MSIGSLSSAAYLPSAYDPLSLQLQSTLANCVACPSSSTSSAQGNINNLVNQVNNAQSSISATLGQYINTYA